MINKASYCVKKYQNLYKTCVQISDKDRKLFIWL